MIQSWYIACDTHLFLTAPVIVSVLYHRPRVGNAVLALLLVASISTTFFVTYSGKLEAFLLVHIKTLRDPIANKTFRSLYVPTHTRATPYYIGMITGLVRYKMKRSSYKINKVGARVQHRGGHVLTARDGAEEAATGIESGRFF